MESNGQVIVRKFGQALAPSGLNVVGVADPARWDALAGPAHQSGVLLPGARAFLVVGNGGSAFWEAFLADLEAEPGHLIDDPNPLDSFARRSVLAADAALDGIPRRWFWAAMDTDVHLDFRVLARLAGFGAGGRLGLLMHPVHGPWLGLRAACLVAADLPRAVPSEADPCAGCPAPCVAACPGGAFPTGRWQVDACSSFKLAGPVCEGTCHARVACPAGAGSRYPAEQLRYHSHRASGRAWLRSRLGVPEGADRFAGDGPWWGDWRSRVDVSGR